MNQRQPWPQLRESLSDVIAGYLEIASPADPLEADRIAACTWSVSPNPVNGPGESALNGIAAATEPELHPLSCAAAQLTRRHPALACCRNADPGRCCEIRMLETTTPMAGALAPIGDRSEDTQNRLICVQ